MNSKNCESPQSFSPCSHTRCPSGGFCFLQSVGRNRAGHTASHARPEHPVHMGGRKISTVEGEGGAFQSGHGPVTYPHGSNCRSAHKVGQRRNAGKRIRLLVSNRLPGSQGMGFRHVSGNFRFPIEGAELRSQASVGAGRNFGSPHRVSLCIAGPAVYAGFTRR
jgi:hypothetical protein